ncbi:hypothetical protein UR09_01865 [Candidatus Nitromaritima sp. SCGC AAA799-A02]|nr:hypothetical protein UR09_01865 [Candidatus Nitromaritima sp. SCGC AAA799-A02]
MKNAAQFLPKTVLAHLPHKVKELAGHKDISSTQRYAHLRRKDLIDSIQVLNYSDFIIGDKNKDLQEAVNP